MPEAHDRAGGAGGPGFLALLAHELKAPMTAVEGYLRLVRGRAKGDDLAAYDHMLDRAAARLGAMRRLVDNLLDLARLDGGRSHHPEDVDLADLAGRAVEDFAAVAAAKHVAITLDAPETLMFHADPEDLAAVLDNLLSNAIKYNKDGGTVAVTLRMDGPAVSVAVADSGVGMTEAERRKLFEDFSRIRNEHTKHIEGSGLGLAIIKRVCALYGGDVTVESTPGVGSVFTATFRN